MPDRKSVIKLGKAMLKAFYESVDLSGYQIVDVEMPLSARLYTDESEATDFKLIGIIDLLLMDENRELIVVDNKTAIKPKSKSDVVYQSQHSQKQLRISMQTPVNDPMETIAAFGKQFQLSLDETEIVRQAYYLEQGATMFHIINAFTRAAQEPDLTAIDAYKLERTGGQILALIKG